MVLPQVVSNYRSLMLLNSLVKVSARVADIACVAQATLKMIHSALLIYKGWLVFPHFYFILDLPTCVHRADIHIDLPTEVSKLSAHCVCRFLIFEREHYSDWGFLLLRYLLFLTVCNIFMLRFFIFYSHLKMASERSKRRDLLACIFI